jgi:hypothetical protein
VKGSVRAEEKLKRDRAMQLHAAYVEKVRTERAEFAARQTRESERRLERQSSLRDDAKKQRLAERKQMWQPNPTEKRESPAVVRRQSPERGASPQISDSMPARKGVSRKTSSLRVAAANRKATQRVSARRLAGISQVQAGQGPLISGKKTAVKSIALGSDAQRDRPQTAPVREELSHRQIRDAERARSVQLRKKSGVRRLSEMQQLRSAKEEASSRAETQRQEQATARASDRRASDDQRTERRQLQKSVGLRRAEEHRQSVRPKQTQGSSTLRAAARGQLKTGPKLPAGARSAYAAPRPSLASPTLYNEPADSLSWLRAAGPFIVDENGSGVALRGVSVAGLDTVAPREGQPLASALSLDEANLNMLSDLWGINIVRIPFKAQTILAGNASLSSDSILAGVDDLIAELAALNVYVLLSLQAPPPPVLSSVAPLPDQSIFDCWKLIAIHYQDEPAVLFEIYSSPFPIDSAWLVAAQPLIGAIRTEHPASLLFVGSGTGDVDTTGLPLLFTTGDPTPNLVYTLGMAAGRQPSLANENALAKLSQSFPLFASDWSTSSTGDTDRSPENAANLFSRYGIGWAAENWNAEPALVLDPLAHNFVPTRWGYAVQRAMTLPVKEPLDKLLPQ